MTKIIDDFPLNFITNPRTISISFSLIFQKRHLVRNSSDGRFMSTALLAFQSSEDPVDDSNVLSEARPQELAVLVTTEPVHVVDLGHLKIVKGKNNR